MTARPKTGPTSEIADHPAAPRHPDADLIIEAEHEPAPCDQIWPVVNGRERAQRNEARRQRLADALRKQRPRHWLAAFEIADETLRAPGSIVVKRENRPPVYLELARALAQGSFEDDGRTHVHWLGGHGGRMTRSRIVTLARGYSPYSTDAGVFENPDFLKDIVAQLVFPIIAVASYFRAQGVPWPESWGVDPTGEARGTSTPTAGQPSAKRGRGRGKYYGQLLIQLRALKDADWDKVQGMSSRARARMIERDKARLKLSGLPKSPTALRDGVDAAFQRVREERQKQKSERAA